jgi:hypothetical protein
VNHKNIDESVFNDFFGKDHYIETAFDNFQHFDHEGLKGRLLSSSYVPAEGDPKCDAMLNALKELFERFQKNGQVIIEYDTRIYYGKPSGI